MVLCGMQSSPTEQVYLVPWAQFQEALVRQSLSCLQETHIGTALPRTGELKVLDEPFPQGVHSVLDDT